MTKIEDRIARKKQLLDAMTAQLKNLKAQETRQRRKDETRRKIIYGAAILLDIELMTPKQRKIMLGRIHRHVVRKIDREFLGLRPMKADEAEQWQRGPDNPELPLDFG